MSILEAMKSRYATKKFDASKNISDQDLQTILESINLSPTSYGLQLFKVIRVTNEELKKQITPVAWGQSQIEDASELLVFTAKKSFKDDDVDQYIDRVSSQRGVEKDQLKGYGDFMKSKIGEMPTEHFQSWTGRQPYIALGNAMTVAATLGIDSCPMEGFDPDQLATILNLTESEYHPVVILALGHRSSEDATQHAPKVRKALDQLVETM